jgi:hypothetical protein
MVFVSILAFASLFRLLGLFYKSCSACMIELWQSSPNFNCLVWPIWPFLAFLAFSAKVAQLA